MNQATGVAVLAGLLISPLIGARAQEAAAPADVAAAIAVDQGEPAQARGAHPAARDAAPLADAAPQEEQAQEEQAREEQAQEEAKPEQEGQEDEQKEDRAEADAGAIRGAAQIRRAITIIAGAAPAAPAVAAAEAGAEGAEDDPNLVALKQQFTQQLRPALDAELHFVRMICRPDNEQYARIKDESHTAFERVVRQFVDVQKQMMQGQWNPQQAGYPDPSQEIARQLAETVKQVPSPEQAARYQAEIEKRAAARKRTIVLNLVARMDKDLVLTSDQRDKLVPLLAENWNEAWGRQLQLYMSDDYNYPTLPDQLIEPLLDENQRLVWSGIPKNVNVFFGFGGFNGIQVIEVEGDVVVAEGAALLVPAQAAPAEHAPAPEEPQPDAPATGNDPPGSMP